MSNATTGRKCRHVRQTLRGVGSGLAALGLAASALIACGLSASSAFAGSVFMKNGYIIQGPVVERDDESLVLGWEHGKMRIHWRFVDQIVYDAGEEEQLEEWARLQAEDAEKAEDEVLVSEAPIDSKTLPDDLRDLLERFDDPTLGEDGGLHDPSVSIGELPLTSDTGEGTTDTEDPALSVDPEDTGSVGTLVEGTTDWPEDVGTETDPDPTSVGDPFEVGTIDKPSFEFAKDATRSDGVVAFRVPEEWNVRETDHVFEASNTDAADVRVSMNVVEWPRGDLTDDQARDAFRSALGSVLDDHEVLEEGPQTLSSGAEGWVYVVRGTRQGQARMVRQALLPREDRFVLISGFSVGDQEDPSFALVEACMGTFQYHERD